MQAVISREFSSDTGWLGSLFLMGHLFRSEYEQIYKFFRFTEKQRDAVEWLRAEYLDVYSSQHNIPKDRLKVVVTFAKMGVVENMHIKIITLTMFEKTGLFVKAKEIRLIQIGVNGGKRLLNLRRWTNATGKACLTTPVQN